MTRFDPARDWGLALMFLAALLATAIALRNYLAPMTGVTGTLGALLVVVSGLLLVLDAIVLFFLPRGTLRTILLTLAVLGAVGTFAAAWFLHAWGLMAAVVVVAFAIIVDVIVRRSHATTVSAS